MQFQTAKVIFLLNVLGFGLMLALTLVLAKGEKRLKVLGWICLVFNLSVFAAPLFIMVINNYTRTTYNINLVKLHFLLISNYILINLSLWNNIVN